MEDDGARHVDDERVHDLVLKQGQEVVAGEPGFGGTAGRLKREAAARLLRDRDDRAWLIGAVRLGKVRLGFT